MAIDFNKIPFKQARWFKPVATRNRRKIVIHTMESPESVKTAENVAAYFQRLTVPASAHYCIDSDSIVQCVQTIHVAYAAPGANHDGIHLELAGYAKQGALDWQDAYSQAMLKNAARLCARILLPKIPIPLKVLTVADLKNDPAASGFTTHDSVSKAFKKSTHWDPGPNFPMAQFLGFIQADMRGNLT